MAELREVFPGIKFGIYNRRHISGSIRWSQHSWPNAIDIFFTAYGDISPEHQARLDEVYDYIRLRWGHFATNHLLWRRRNHWDHIHWDGWPTGWGTPSTTRGGTDNMYLTIDGDFITQAELLGAAKGDEQMIGPGSSATATLAVQEALLEGGYELPEWGADGDYGPETTDAVVLFQTDRGLERTGVVDGVTAAFLIPGPQGPRGRRGRTGPVPNLADYTLQPSPVVE